MGGVSRPSALRLPHGRAKLRWLAIKRPRTAYDGRGLTPRRLSMQDETTTPYGYCKCGCGEKTKLAPRTITKFGYVRGEPYPWVRGHGHRKPKPYTGDWLCQCGCDELAPIARWTNGNSIAGHPLRYVYGHAARGVRKTDRYRVEDRGYKTPCWIWQLALNGDGYSSTSNGSAHRLHYTKAYGEIPAGLELDHLCRVRECVNPEHLEPVTHAENMRRAAGLRPPAPQS
jgi:hypothetical protein